VVSPDYRSAIEAIKAVRTNLRISQRELARRLKKPPSFVNKFEQFERRLDTIESIAIAMALNITSAQLLKSPTALLPSPVLGFRDGHWLWDRNRYALAAD
jgi:transcriptional regulator with XRE-family HTH domain